MAALPQEGYYDLRRRLRIVSLTLARRRLAEEIFKAETELGWLGWEQVEFYAEETSAQVAKIKEFENAQASLQNVSAELSSRKAALDEELARESAAHDQIQASIAAQRAPFAGRMQEVETDRSEKLAVVQRFERALAEMAGREQELEELSRSFMNIENPTMAIRAEARETSDELARIGGERKLLLVGKANAANELAIVDTELAGLRAEVQRIDADSAAAHENFAAVSDRLSGEMSQLEQEKEKSSLHMANIDTEKQEPYRFIGACLADHDIAPRNQPEALGKVLTLRDRDFQLIEEIEALRAACAAVPRIILVVFYLLLLVVILTVSAVLIHIL